MYWLNLSIHIKNITKKNYCKRRRQVRLLENVKFLAKTLTSFSETNYNHG